MKMRLFAMHAMVLLFVFAFPLTVSSQKSFKTADNKDSLKTAVFTLDVGLPRIGSLNNTSIRRKNLNANWRESISFQLINANPFKYNYSIAGKSVSLFANSTNPFDSLISISNKRNSVEHGDAPTAADGPDNAVKTAFQKKMITKLYADPALATMFLQLNIPTQDSINSQEAVEKRMINLMLAYDQIAENILHDLQNYQNRLGAEDYLNRAELLKNRDSMRHIADSLIDKSNSAVQIIKGLNSSVPKFDSIHAHFTADITAIGQIVKKLYSVQLDYYTLPFDISWKNNDYLEITVDRQTIIPAGGKIDAFQYNIWISGGFKMDVSGGVFVSSLKDDIFFTTDSATSGKKFINSKNEGNMGFGFGSMLNVAYRTGTQWIRPALSFGVLFNNQQKFQILCGGGFMIGKEQRIVLHYGLAMGIVQQLETGYKADDPSVAYNLGTSGQVPVSNKFKTGHFFGLTYNFTKSSAKKAGEN